MVKHKRSSTSYPIQLALFGRLTPSASRGGLHDQIPFDTQEQLQFSIKVSRFKKMRLKPTRLL